MYIGLVISFIALLCILSFCRQRRKRWRRQYNGKLILFTYSMIYHMYYTVIHLKVSSHTKLRYKQMGIFIKASNKHHKIFLIFKINTHGMHIYSLVNLIVRHCLDDAKNWPSLRACWVDFLC